MKNIISYDEFISEDYRDVAGCGSGGKHADDNTTILANGSGSSIIDVIGHPTGDKKVLGTELIKNVKGEYWRQKRDKSKRETNIEEEKKKRMRRKAYKALSDVDTIAENKNNTMRNIKNFTTFINEMLNYDFWELVPDEYCQGLKPGDSFQFDDKDYTYVVGQIIYPKHGDPKENGCVEYWPEITPVANPSMFHLFAIDKIEDGPDFKIITLKKD